ncbi:helix-turn-helix transcriptional regulator [Butyrivibrio sp. AE2015]|uniref:helix-turn-helix transcriptional regulator n=1 Tax=Butyrivibrio sp. AE2015 TaxID=1280663 RepID=UPI0003B4072C|nr:helix-turn-helix transcriptional regulator [Butyrivibrio sp. AE2015]
MAKRLERTGYDSSKLASQIKLFREYLGLTCREFGERIGYSGSYINQCEHELIEVPANIISLICENYNIDEEYFAGKISLKEATKHISTQAEIDADRAKRLKMLRKRFGMTQTMLYDVSGVDNKAISKIETFERPLEKEQAEMIAKALNIGVDWLLYGNEKRMNYPIDDRIIDWLWENGDVRKKLWDTYKSDMSQKKTAKRKISR